MSITKASESDAGCWVEGSWGQYAVAHMIDKAQSYGYSEAEVTDLADRHLASMGPSDAPGLTDDEHEALIDAGDDAERWLNENVAPEGYSFGWNDGEFFLQSAQWWDSESY